MFGEKLRKVTGSVITGWNRFDGGGSLWAQFELIEIVEWLHIRRHSFR